MNLKISSLKDLNSDEFDFLNSRYGITYKYSDEDYHLDDLIKTINKFKEFIPSNIQINLEGAQSILNYIFSQFELYVPKEYVEKRKTVKLKSGEEIGLPNFKVVENTNYYTEVENIFKEKTATEKGFRKICREVLKLAGFYIIDNIESFTNTIKKYDLIIDDIKYQIVVNRNGIILQK